MAFARPTLSQLVERIQADFISRLDLATALLRRAMVYVLSRVIAGAAHLLHGHLEYLGRQLFPDTSEDEFLIRQAALFGVTKNAATFAKASASVTGSNGTVIPEDTRVVSELGFEYTVDAEATIAGGTAAIALTAVLAGADPTLTAAQSLSFESPIAGADSTFSVTASTQDGSDEEDIEGLRTRFKARLASPPHGGNDEDYIAWAKEVTGVTRAWPVGNGLGPGTVLVRFARDEDASPIPDAGEVTAVQDYIDALAPAHATVTVAAPTGLARAFTFTMISPDTAAVRAAVEAELADLILREGEPGGTLLLSAIRTAIGNAAGVEDYTLTVPAADVTHTAGQIPLMGTVTWP